MRRSNPRERHRMLIWLDDPHDSIYHAATARASTRTNDGLLGSLYEMEEISKMEVLLETNMKYLYKSVHRLVSCWYWQGSYVLFGNPDHEYYPGIALSTANRPNEFSNQTLGNYSCKRLWAKQNFDGDERHKWNWIHPDLWRPDGTIFVFGFRATLSYYQRSIDHPLF